MREGGPPPLRSGFCQIARGTLGLDGRRRLAREQQGRASLPLGVRSGGAVRSGVCGAGQEDGGSGL